MSISVYVKIKRLKPNKENFRMKKYRELKNGESANELENAIELIIKTKCPTKWIIEDLETGQRYRANGNTEIGKMFTLIEDENDK